MKYDNPELIIDRIIDKVGFDNSFSERVLHFQINTRSPKTLTLSPPIEIEPHTMPLYYCCWLHNM